MSTTKLGSALKSPAALGTGTARRSVSSQQQQQQQQQQQMLEPLKNIHRAAETVSKGRKLQEKSRYCTNQCLLQGWCPMGDSTCN
jgi:hypothetical protein